MKTYRISWAGAAEALVFLWIVVSVGLSGKADAALAETLPAATTLAMPGGWQPWAPRDEIRPHFKFDPSVGRRQPGALAIDCQGNVAAFGAWRQTITGVQPGRTYRFTAWYRAQGVAFERRSIIARLGWLDAEGRSMAPPDYAGCPRRDDDWRLMEYIATAPAKAASVEVWLCLGFTEKGRVWWDDVTFTEEPNPPDRVVRVVTIHHRPAHSSSPAESVAQFCRCLEDAASLKPDLVCLPEGITVVGTDRSDVEVSEPVPGPTTQRLGELARRLRTYIVAGIYEREGKVVYNTAVLIGRNGELAGRYRKTHLPREEWEIGLTHGNEYPVFDTDFGRVGVMICWDVQFSEPARALAAQGAELILVPIWGGNEILARARAIENHVFLVTSSYDMKTFVLDPLGNVMAEATEASPIALAEIHLDRKYPAPWLGDMRTRTWQERRPDIPVP